jgi:hypothetical protein
MTQLLKNAFAEAEKLPREEQNAFATWLLEELASEKRWSDLFAASQHKLADFAAEAIEENRSVGTAPLNPDRL